MAGIIECQATLLDLAESKGYLTFDDIMDTADAFLLSVTQVDQISEAIQLRGIVVYETAPQPQAADDELEDYSRSDYETIFAEIISQSCELETLVNEVRMIPPPQYRETSLLTTQVANGNAFARERLISLYMRNALKIALAMTKQYELSIEDAVSAGLIGLINAVDRFDPNGFSAFPSYASMWIQQSIQRECTPFWMDFYFPAHYKTNLFRVYLLFRELSTSETTGGVQEEYLLQKIARALELDVEQVRSYLECVQVQKRRLSLDFILEAYEEGTADYPQELVEEHDSVFDEVFCASRGEIINDALATLTEREQLVLHMRHGFGEYEPKTLDEVGQYLNVTRERVRQIENKAIRKLQHPSRIKRLQDLD